VNDKSSAARLSCFRVFAYGIRWHDFVRDSEVSLRTGLAPVSDQITRGSNAIFGRVARIDLRQRSRRSRNQSRVEALYEHREEPEQK